MSLFQDEHLPPFSNAMEQNNNNIKIKSFSQIIDELKSLIISFRLFLSKNLNVEINGKISKYYDEINNLLNILINLINSYNIQNEVLQRKDEQKIRILYGKYLHQKVINEILETRISVLNKKEKEYELLKQKTGAIVCNGEIICNERKDNEIIIL